MRLRPLPLVAALLVLGCPAGDTPGDDDDTATPADDDTATPDDDDTAIPDDDTADDCADHCSNGVADCGETDLDCGGSCPACDEVTLCSGSCVFPAVAATQAVVVAVWGDEEDSHHLHYSCKDGSGWTSPQQVPDLGANSDFGRLETDSMGRVHLVVHAGMGDNRAAMYAVFDAPSGCSGSWSSPVQVDDGTDNSCWPQIAIDGQDDPHICWTDEDYYAIHCASSEGGTWDPPQTVVSSAVQSCHSDLTASGSTLHVVWQEGDAPRLPVYSHSTGSGFTEPYELSASFHNWPQIVADASGDLHVLYTYRNGDHEVKYRKMTAGSWGAEQQVSAPPSEWTWPGLAIDATGGLHAVWHQTDDVEHVYYGVGDSSSGAWQSPRRISTDSSLQNRDATLSVDGDGRAHVVWVHKEDPVDADTTGQVRYRVVTWDDLAP